MLLSHVDPDPPAQMVIRVAHPRRPGEVLAVLVVDRVVDNMCLGGIRARAGVTEAEVAELAREMTYQCAFWRIRAGGAKVGMPAPLPEDAAERRSLLRYLGRQLAPLLRNEMYWACAGLGIRAEDVQAVLEGAGVASAPNGGERPEEYYTALSVAVTAEVLCQQQGETLRGKRVHLDGFGGVGEHCAGLLRDRGCVLTGVSTPLGCVLDPNGLDVGELGALWQAYGERFVERVPGTRVRPPEALLGAECDLLVACAGPYTFDAEAIRRVRARWVVPGVALTTRPGHDEFWERSRAVYCPGYVAGAGAVLVPRVRQWVREPERVDVVLMAECRERVHALVRRAEEDGVSLMAAARHTVWETLAEWEPLSPPREPLLRMLARRAYRRLQR